MNVLILIILEYIYIFEYGDLTVLAGVLILIILEYIYILLVWAVICLVSCLNPYYTGIHLHKLNFNLWNGLLVLILIILEYIYICENPDKDSQILRLNPYYTGIHLHNI